MRKIVQGTLENCIRQEQEKQMYEALISGKEYKYRGYTIDYGENVTEDMKDLIKKETKITVIHAIKWASIAAIFYVLYALTKFFYS